MASHRMVGILIGCLFLAGRAEAAEVRGEIVDAETGTPLPARLYLRGADGQWHYARSASSEGSAVRYEKQNWINKNSIEYHTTLSAHPFTAELAPGNYELTVEHGKEYFPLQQELRVGSEMVELRLPLRRWIRMAQRGWYSGDTHVHRRLAELPNVVLAEDLNVTFPLSYWVTRAFQPPATGDKNLAEELPDRLLQVDPSHVIWPRNTEYEIFSVGPQRHTLGALFVLNHREVLDQGVPPWGPVAERTRNSGALLDMDKLDWPFSMILPPVTGAQLYELANNHLWRTEFAFTNWNSPAPSWMQPPRGGLRGGEREWLHYTLGMYYTLLNCGFPLVPTAGTANGVHPVPAGFSRVYVHLPGDFNYEDWLRGLREGRSFVTTGPMLLATMDGQHPGATREFDAGGGKVEIAAEVLSEQPLAFSELVFNGVPLKTYMARNERLASGAYRNLIRDELPCLESGWLVLRSWEDRDAGRFRFAHSAPWHIRVAGSELRPRAEEREYLLQRVTAEIERSRSVLPPDALAEYERALAVYQKLPVRDEEAAISAEARQGPEIEQRKWLQNMKAHGFTLHEMHAATGIALDELARALRELEPVSVAAGGEPQLLRVLPYPGGRHPRRGFRDGALRPQRDTKVSVFTPWDPESYVVVDVPEAIFTHLGLTYLAHTHVPTLWTEQQVELPPLEWSVAEDGRLSLERTLPNGIAFGAEVEPRKDGVRMELWLRNGTAEPLNRMRAQVCVMLNGAPEFGAQTNRNKVLEEPFVAVRSEDGRRWVITAWQPCQRAWANPPVPCLHSDPSLPDCAPGATVRARGWLSFYEGEDVQAEFRRLAENF